MSNPVVGELVRECRHPRAVHVHGTRAAYVADRCRCPACRQANREAAQGRRRAIAYGRWQPYVDAGPIREHLQRLREAGLGIERIIQLSGVGSGTVRQLVYGDRRTGAAVRRVRPATAARLLALDPAATPLAGGHLTDSIGTRRRLQSLIAAGWSLPRLAQQVGSPGERVTFQPAEAADQDVHRSNCCRRLHGVGSRRPATIHAWATTRGRSRTRAGSRAWLGTTAGLGRHRRRSRACTGAGDARVSSRLSPAASVVR